MAAPTSRRLIVAAGASFGRLIGGKLHPIDHVNALLSQSRETDRLTTLAVLARNQRAGAYQLLRYAGRIGPLQISFLNIPGST